MVTDGVMMPFLKAKIVRSCFERLLWNVRLPILKKWLKNLKQD